MTAQDEIKILEDFITKKIPLSPVAWLDHIGRVVVMMSEETDRLYALEKQVARMADDYRIEMKSSMAQAKNFVKTSDQYEEMQRQRARCKQIEELIRIGKAQSKLKNEEWGSNSLIS